MVPNAARINGMLAGLILFAVTSCESTDRRLTDFAERAHEQQARQNENWAEQSRAMAQQSHEVAAAARELVEQDAMARRDLLDAHQQLQQQAHGERVDLDRQRREIDHDRKAAAQSAVRDSVIGQAILTVGLALAALVPLVVTTYALRQLPGNFASDQLLADLLADATWPNRDATPVIPPDHVSRLVGVDELTAENNRPA